jgi:hypothetical protein
VRRARHAADREHRLDLLIVAEKKAYPLRISPLVLDAVQRWADDDLRSVNAQIEYLLREALRKSNRLARNPIDPGNAEPKE